MWCVGGSIEFTFIVRHRSQPFLHLVGLVYMCHPPSHLTVSAKRIGHSLVKTRTHGFCLRSYTRSFRTRSYKYLRTESLQVAVIVPI